MGSTSYGRDATAFSVGSRVRLVRMDDPWAKAPEGTVGTVVGVAPKPVNVLNVRWDNGFHLNPCLDEDVVVLVSGERGCDGALEGSGQTWPPSTTL